MRSLRLIIICVFITIFTALVLPNLLHQNVIGDESVYILEGDRYLHQPYSYYHNSGSPILLKILSAMTYSYLPLNRDYAKYFPQTVTDVTKSAEFLYIQNPAYAQTIIVSARIPHLLLALVLGIAIFLFTWKIYSKKIAIISLVLYTFNAIILAHAGTANLDLGTTAFIFFTTVTYYTLLKSTPTHNQKNILLLIGSGVLLGLSQASKISAILLYPFLIILCATTSSFRHKWRELLFIVLISILSLWALYSFQVGPVLLSGEDPAGIESIYSKIPLLSVYKSQITQLLYLPIFPLGAYINNFTYQSTHNFYGHTTYIQGVFTDQKIWYYFPLSFILKNSVVLLVLLVISVVACIYSKSWRHDKYRLLLLWIIIYYAWISSGNLQLGTRYLMPIYPFLYIAAAVGLTSLEKTVREQLSHNGKYLIPVVLTLYSISTMSVAPNYFTYINEVFSSSTKLNLTFDSDYDWGQSVFKIGEIQKEKNWYPAYIRTFGGANYSYYSITNTKAPHEIDFKTTPGYYIFSHSSLVNYKKSDPVLFEYFSNHKPTYIIDNVIYAYKVE